MNKEIWKDIKGYEGLYQISNYGRCKSLYKKVDIYRKTTGEIYKRRKYPEKILKPGLDFLGYHHYILSKNGKEKLFKAHRLVASAFIDENINGKIVKHKDKDKLNNIVENLEVIEK